MLVFRVLKTILLLLIVSSNIAFAKKLVVVGELSPPYLYENNGEVIGIDAEIIKYILTKLGLEYEISLCPLARCVEMLKFGQADIGISFAKTEKLAPYLIFPKVFTRTNEYVLATNPHTKYKHDVTSLSYVKRNNLEIGLVRGNTYNDFLWDLFPWPSIKTQTYDSQITPVQDISFGLRMLGLNRVNVVLGEKRSLSYTANQLKLEDISQYDFIAFFQATMNVFSKTSKFHNKIYPEINQLLSDYEKVFLEFKQLPNFHHIFNWDWEKQPIYKVEKSTDIVKAKEQKLNIGEEISIGFLADLSGPSSGWGKPGLTGINMFIDDVNSQGGLLVYGARHPLKLYIYDDKSKPDLAKKGAKFLVEKHNVKFISGIGGASADAIHPYLSQHKIIYASLISTDIRPDRPYLIAGGDVTPRIDMLRPWYHKNKNPILKKWAVISQDDPIARTSQAWEVGAATSEGWDIVYDQHFPLNISDYQTLVSDILATTPDVISLNLTWPGFVPLILEELFKQGYRGELSGNYLDVEHDLKYVPSWFHEGAVDSFPLFNDPFWGYPSKQHDFYSKWVKRYGKGAPDSLNREITGIDWDHVIMLEIWALGAQLAKSFEAEKIIKALRAQKTFPTLLGRAKMSGQVMWGIQNMVSIPIPINETRNGLKRIQTVKLFDAWFESNKVEIIKVVKSKGLYWGNEQ